MNKNRDQRMEDPAGNLAVTLLAYADMGQMDRVELLFKESDPNTLGRALALWIKICINETGKDRVLQEAQHVAAALETRLDSLRKKRPIHERHASETATLGFIRTALTSLAEDDMETFGTMWDTAQASEETRLKICSTLLGFTRSLLNGTPREYDCE